MTLTKQEKIIAKQYALNKASFMFIPSSDLCGKIAKNHPQTKKINEKLKIFLLEKKAIRIDPEMIIKYCDNKLDKNNTWLLNQGDIKVEPLKIEI